MPLSTKLTRALGIKHPLIQGGMHYVGYAPLVTISTQCFFLEPSSVKQNYLSNILQYKIVTCAPVTEEMSQMTRKGVTCDDVNTCDMGHLTYDTFTL